MRRRWSDIFEVAVTLEISSEPRRPRLHGTRRLRIGDWRFLESQIPHPRFIFLRIIFLADSEILDFSAQSLRQLLARHLTGRCVRVMNRSSRKNSSRRFPHNKKICATMPD